MRETMLFVILNLFGFLRVGIFMLEKEGSNPLLYKNI